MNREIKKEEEGTGKSKENVQGKGKRERRLR